MRIRFGYVAMSTVLKDCSPSRTVTATNLAKLEEEEARILRLSRLAAENLRNTQRLFYYNEAHDIKVFRLTSKLVPLATHPLTANWNWGDQLEDEFRVLGKYAREHGFRISAHPDHFTLLNSPKDEVIQASLRDLEYHNTVFNKMGMDSSAKLVIHVGGLYGDKEGSVKRFIRNYELLPSSLKGRIVLENDDKIYTAEDVLNLCQILGIPMVLDIHHHWCNPGGKSIEDLLRPIFDTWQDQPLVPKIHLSSPRSQKKFRSHADDVDPAFFLDFLQKVKPLGEDFDVMIEAKNKDMALFNLMDHLKYIPYIKVLDQASIEYA